MMRFPWSRHKDDSEAVEQHKEDDGMGRDYTRDEWDEDEQDTEEGGEQDDELANLDEDTRATVDAYVAKQKTAALAEQRAALRTTFQESGFDLNEDGKPLIADPAKVAAFAGSLGGPLRQAPSPAANAAPEPSGDDPKPDMYTDQEAYEQWVERRAEKRLEAALEKRFAELTPRIEQQEQWRLSVAERQTLDRAQALLPGSAFPQLGAQEHQDAFQAAFLDLYRGVPADRRSGLTDEDIEQLAAATIPKVLRRGQQGRDDAGRFTGERSRNAALYQQSHQPHPDGTRAPRTPPPTEMEQEQMRRHSLTLAEAQALSGEVVTYEDWKASQDAGKAKARR